MAAIAGFDASASRSRRTVRSSTSRAASADMAAIAGFDASASRCRRTVRNSTSRAASADMAAIAGFDASASRCRMTVRNSTGRTATPARSLPRALRNSDPAAAVRLPSGRGVAPSSECLPADSNPRSALSAVFCMARDRWTWPVISRTSCLTFFPRYSCLPTSCWKASAYPIPRAIQRAVPRAAATHARLHRCTSS